MADVEGETQLDRGDRPHNAAADSPVAMDSLLTTLRGLEVELRQRDISETSSSDYCNNFCQALMHYAGSRNSIEHGLPLLEVYCLSITCFVAARPHLTTESDKVALVLKRLALSCFELLLSVPENAIPYEAWMQFHRSVQAAHDTLQQYGSTDLLALLRILGEGGAWSNPALIALLTGQPTNPEEVDAFLALEGDSFMEMRVKHLVKMGEMAQAMVLAKACADCGHIANRTTFRQIYVTQLCDVLPSEEAIMEISRVDGKEVLEIICNLETEGQENLAFILCTTFLTQQLQQESIYCSWELTLFWSKLQRRIEPSLESFLEHCLQLGAIARTVYHLLFLVRVIQTEAEQLGVAASVELCVRALQLPRLEDPETKTSVCKTVACLLPDDLEVRRACQLTEFLLCTSQAAYASLEELHLRPDQRQEEHPAPVPNSLRCELLLALKAHWPFDPEFWDWKTLKRHCLRLLGVEPEPEPEPEEEEEEGPAVDGGGAGVCREMGRRVTQEEEVQEVEVKEEPRGDAVARREEPGRSRAAAAGEAKEAKKRAQGEDKEAAGAPKATPPKKAAPGTSERYLRWQKYKFFCLICRLEVIEARILHHSRKHVQGGVYTCPVCLRKFRARQEFAAHTSEHVQMPARRRPPQRKRKAVKRRANPRRGLDEEEEEEEDEEEEEEDELDDALEPGEIGLDPSLLMYYRSTRDPDVLEHLLEQAAALPRPRRPAPADDDHVTFEYIDAHFQLQDREVYPCPATGCAKNFRQFKYLSVHLKAEHGGGHGDENARHYLAMKDRREKCTFCRRHFVTAYHHRRHRRAHRGERPYTCAVAGCGARFDTTNQLLSHKQGHGFRLSYRCQLRGCSLAFCDLGQLYHHEAQHFRDAAYCCTAAGCKKFYYSKRDFLRHLASHGIAFSEQDFAAQREERRRPPDPFADEPAGARKGVPEEPPGRRSGDAGLGACSPATGTAVTTASSSSSPSSSSSLKEPRGTLTCVAVCFDGRKFTCGFESCGRTFAQASEVQRHLRCAHPGQMEAERRGPKRPGKARGPRTRERDVKIEPGGADKSPQGPGCPPAQGVGREGSCSPAAEPHKPLVPPPSSPPPIEDSLKDVLLGLGRLSLRAASPRSSPCHPRQPISGSSVTPVSLPPASSAGASPAPAARASRKKAAPKPAPAAAEKRAPSPPPPPPPSPPPSPSPPSSPERPPATRRISDFLVQPSTKPYGCEVRGCAFKSVTSNALKGHYLRKHGFSRERVKGIAVFRSNAFKPFRCHLCPRCYRQKSELRLHYMQVHQVSESLVEQMSCSSRRREEGKAPEPPARARPGAGARQGHLPQRRQAGKTPPPPPPKEERRAASAWRRQKRPKEKGGIWMLQSERENGVVRPGDKGRKTGAKPAAAKPAPPALRDHRGAQEEEEGEEEEERASRGEGRGSRRLVAKGNLCYILTKYHKPYHCVHKDCGSAFTRQSGLVRHLQAVHRYNRAQLCLEEDLELRRGAGVRKADAAAASAKPQRLHCQHKGCGKHFHNSSGLWQHRRRQHGDKPPPPSPPETPPRVPGRGAEPATPPSSEEPIPQFRCSYGDCAATYHLYSSLLRHTSHVHRGQPPQGAPAPPQQQQQQQVRCRFEGCTRVFSQNSSYMKHVFYRHCDYYDSVVLRLQNAHKRDASASGCQKKLIISAALKKKQQQPPPPPLKNTPKLPLRHSLRRCPKSQEALRAEEEEEEEEEEEGTGENTEEEPMEEEVPKAPRLRKRDLKLVYRTQEEALQMCQDRCLPVAYPCMVQGCDSVLTVESSMRRHYLTCHRMPCHVFASSQGALVNTAERLEELIQRRSALSSAARSPHGVLKVEYQAEPENPGGLSLPMSLHSVEEDPPGAPGPPGPGGEESAAESDATVGADDLLPRNGRRGDPAEDQQPPLARSPHTPAPSSVPAPVDLSPPATLRFTPDEPPTDPPDRECGRTGSSASADADSPDAPTCSPLKCKSEPPEAPPPRQPVPSPAHAPPPRPFDLAAYKPMGFESSFLKFIQENQNKEEQFGEGGAWGSHLHHHHHRHHRRHRNRHRAAAEPPATASSPRRCRDPRRRGRSVKENSRRGLTVTVTRSRRLRPSPLEPLLCAGEYASVQNLRSILDRALTGCGDLAIKQLQYLRPVVVLERSKFSASSLLDLFPAKKTEKLVLRASS
ncbi:zinc finger protein Rlf [Anguilla rostrata]|uniref:zinc finger protein Rlf n=1 Tax=Anguilla rostrata TaxID=7938 RepID=UPI0030D10119